MTNDTLSEKIEWFNALGQTYKFTIINRFDYDNVLRIWKLWKSYGGSRLKDNYTQEALRRVLGAQRFDLGFYIVERGDETVASFGLTLYNNWAIGTRYIKHSKKVEPIAAVVIAPFLKKYLGDKVEGMAVAYNSEEKRTLSLFNLNSDKLYVYRDLSEDDMKHLREFKELDYEVYYRSTRQRVFYAPYKEGAKPVFERYTGSNDRNKSS